jgi:hypothetical protein
VNRSFARLCCFTLYINNNPTILKIITNHLPDYHMNLHHVENLKSHEVYVHGLNDDLYHLSNVMKFRYIISDQGMPVASF